MFFTIVLFFLVFAAFLQSDFRPLHQKRNLTTWSKFIAALLVVFGHIVAMHYGWNSNERTELTIGSECVSFFLFFSGYGLMHAYATRGQQYLQGFFRKRIIKIIIPLLTAYVIALSVYAFYVGPIDWAEVLTTVTWGGPYLDFSWYVSIIIVLYTLFFFVYRYVSEKVQLLAITIAVLLLSVIMSLSGLREFYYKSLPAFIMGFWYRTYEVSIITWLKNHKWKTAFMTFLFLGIFFGSIRFDKASYYLPCLFKLGTLHEWMVDIAFVLIVVIAIQYLSSPPKKSLLANCYFEIYLLQRPVMYVSSVFFSDKIYIYMPTVLLLP